MAYKRDYKKEYKKFQASKKQKKKRANIIWQKQINTQGQELQ